MKTTIALAFDKAAAHSNMLDLLNQAAPDFEIVAPISNEHEDPLDEIATFTVGELLEEMDDADEHASSSVDRLTQPHSEFGDPIGLLARKESDYTCPIACTTTVINPPPPALLPMRLHDGKDNSDVRTMRGAPRNYCFLWEAPEHLTA